ncbi:hypothetical protein JW905_02460 [bacterium]|nr:hypothetical protein [candidate division CSSED10-310 bacterium]
MLGYWLNHCQLSLRLDQNGPGLIQEGRYGKTDLIKRGLLRNDRPDNFPDTLFVCEESLNELESAVVNRHLQRLTPYIPATTLTGMFRAQAERAILSMNGGAPALACDPNHHDPGAERCFCSTRLQKSGTHAAVLDFYHHSCPVCRMFGNRLFQGALTMNDARCRTSSKARQAPPLMRRSGAIDRITGSLGTRSAVTYQVVEDLRFEAVVEFTNFELWQIGLFLLLLRDVAAGRLAMGARKSLGMGKLLPEITAAEITVHGRSRARDAAIGLGDLLPHQRFGFLIQSAKVTDDCLRQVSAKDLTRCYRITDQQAFEAWMVGEWLHAIAPLTTQRKQELAARG